MGMGDYALAEFGSELLSDSVSSSSVGRLWYPVKMHVGCFIFGGGGGGKQACRWGGLQKGPFIATKWCDFG